MVSTRAAQSERASRTIDWPTLAVAIVIYGGWLAVTQWHAALPAPVLIAVGAWLLAWHGSLQHETIHGHPTRFRAVNRAIGFVPLSLWLPYALYHRSHLAHHGSRAITDPRLDPESRYVDRGNGLAWLAARLQSTLLGHMMFGPPVAVMRFVYGEMRRATKEPVHAARDWLPHILCAALVIGWLDHVGLGVGQYILFFVYPGMALTTLRAHAEHGAELAAPGRAATIERGGPLALLFLNNNLHAAHHARPQLAWYKLPDWHRRNRDHLLAGGATLYGTYGEVIRRYGLRGRGTPLHPSYRADPA